MKKLFTAVRKGDLETLKAVLEKKPDLLHCTATPPPKKDAGQSLLQVAFKCGQMEIAEYLIDQGANVNFMEADDCGNEWRMPVIQDAINAAIMMSRWNTYTEQFGMEVFSTEQEADRSYALLERILEKGVDLNRTDSYGNSGICRAILQANQILPSVDMQTGELRKDRIYTEELEADLSRIFRLLIMHGADLEYMRSKFEQPVWDHFVNPLIKKLLAEVQTDMERTKFS